MGGIISFICRKPQKKTIKVAVGGRPGWHGIFSLCSAAVVRNLFSSIDLAYSSTTVFCLSCQIILTLLQIMKKSS